LRQSPLPWTRNPWRRLSSRLPQWSRAPQWSGAPQWSRAPTTRTRTIRSPPSLAGLHRKAGGRRAHPGAGRGGVRRRGASSAAPFFRDTSRNTRPIAGAPAKIGRSIAPAGKTVLSSAGTAYASREGDAEAMSYYDLGPYGRAVTTVSPEAQRWFNRGL